MKKALSLLVLLLTLCVSTVTAETTDLMKEADAMFVYKNGTLDIYQKTSDMYKQILEEEPGNFDAAWKCARSLRYYAYTAQQKKVEGWKDICAKYGKEGMAYAQKAIDLKPDLPNGYYFFGLNVGVYADGVSILTALKEGLKDKTQSSFEKVIKLDPDYEKAGAVLGLGRFWAVLPWPMKKKKKALEYYRQYQATDFFGQEPEGMVYIPELLIDLGGKDNKEEARQILSQFKSDNPYFIQWSHELQSKL